MFHSAPRSVRRVGGGLIAASAAVVAIAGVAGASTPPSSDAAGGGELIDAERCAANEAAGTITYLSSFDFAAAASIVDVVVAEEKGYYDALCLDVELLPSFSTANYTLVAAGDAQFSSAGSFTEILNFTLPGEAEFEALIAYGKTPIEGLVIPEGGAATLEDLAGQQIGVKGVLPPSIVAMLAGAGLAPGDYVEVPLDGFDPVAHLELGVAALPVYKSNEPGQLEGQGVPFTLVDPAAEGVPGSFGIIYTSADYAEVNPTVVEDFVRATLKGMEDVIADPAGAAEIAFGAIEAAGNSNYLVLEGEQFRANAEVTEVLKGTPEGTPVGLIDPALFKAEYDAYLAAGVWPEGEAPEFGEYWNADVAAAAYGEDGTVIWG